MRRPTSFAVAATLFSLAFLARVNALPISLSAMSSAASVSWTSRSMSSATKVARRRWGA
jgi:hypothetical protein